MDLVGGAGATLGADVIDRSAEYRERVAEERRRQRVRYVRVQLAGSVVLLASTLLTWSKHPGLVPVKNHPTETVVGDVGRSIGLGVVPAGLLVAALGVAALWESRWMSRGQRLAGWISLATSVGVFVIVVVELILMDIQRRDWLSAHYAAGTVWDDAAGVGWGIRLAFFVAIALVATAATFTSRVYGSWRDGARLPG